MDCCNGTSFHPPVIVPVSDKSPIGCTEIWSNLVSEPDCQHFSQFGSLVLTVWIITSQITVPMRLALGPRNLAHIIVVLLTVSRVARALNTLVYNKLCSYVSLTLF